MGDEDIELVPEPPHATAGHRRARHRAVHWAVLMFNVVAVLSCFVGAGILIVGQQFLTQTQKSAAIQAPPTQVSSAPIKPASATNPPGGSTVTIVDNTTGTTIAADIPTTTEPFPQADPQAQNFLITGSDNRACPDANTANPVPNRDTLGERSDTIMIMRVDPATKQAAVLSFPRDLWLKIAGHDGQNRINSAYVKNDPSTLISTLFKNFGIGVDHFVQVDFCAFKTLVDALQGVPVPFAVAARDTHTGLYIAQPGCVTMSGDEALAYVRSRHYQTYSETTGQWTEDPLSDLGRISRQQDFLRRIVAKALNTGVYTPTVARGLISTAQKYVVTDTNLTPEKMLEFAGVVQNVNPSSLHSYQIEVKPAVRSGNDVLIPVLDTANMKAILSLFQGKSPLVGAPDASAVAVDTTPVSPRDVGTTVPVAQDAVAAANAVAAGATVPTTVLTPVVAPVDAGPVATDNGQGVVPPADYTC